MLKYASEQEAKHAQNYKDDKSNPNYPEKLF